MKTFIIIISLLASTSFLLTSCGNNDQTEEAGTSYQCPMKCEGEKTYSDAGTCPVCKMDLKPIGVDEKVLEDNDHISESSIFNLSSKWNTQDNETIELKDLKGDILVVVMIYTTCKAACPRLVADMRSIHDKVNNGSVKYILVSIDPETDTPERLRAFSIENQMDTEEWTFLQGSVDDVREFSNVLAVKYKQISPLDFSHSNIISLFDTEGVLVHQQEGLGVDNKIMVSKILEQVGVDK